MSEPGDQRRAMHGEVPALFVDLYELTMVQAYVDDGVDARATFSLYARDLPPQRGFLLAAGLDAALAAVESLRFTEDDLAHLESLGRFSPGLLDWLAGFRFSGDIRAMPEGTPCFAGEPLLEVDAPIAEAQLLETLLLNQVTYATLVASKGVRSTLAAGDRPVIDFGTRRSHGMDAALVAARALYLAGFTATSNVEAGRRYGIPVTGTMAHSYIQSHDDELAAFRAFTRHFPDTVLLVDTYDTLAGVQHVIDLACDLGDGFQVRAIRLDSGDLAALAVEARAMLDAAGLTQVEIAASGGLDEYGIAALEAASAPVNSYAVGTRVNVSQDASALETVYKLVAFDGHGRRKYSASKSTLPHPKQVYRRSEDGIAAGDVLARADETLSGEPLLVPVMRDGRRLAAGRTDLEQARARALDALGRLPARLRSLDATADDYPVTLSDALRTEAVTDAT